MARTINDGEKGGDPEVFLMTLLRIPASHPERFDLAALAGHIAVIGNNKAALGRRMEKDVRWIRKHMKLLHQIYDD